MFSSEASNRFSGIGMASRSESLDANRFVGESELVLPAYCTSMKSLPFSCCLPS
jgi:hypothetical protein